jgi:two-component system chemotaxis response regulator CheB
VRAQDPLPSRVIGIGASAGGIDALLKLLAALPEDLPHAVLVVQHVGAHAHSVLAQIFDRRCAIAVRAARHADPLLPGRVVVAPPDRHLTISGSRLRLTHDAPEHGVRPAADPLLRSLAIAYGPAAVAVVLSGALDDGAAGARAVAAAGGRVLVQDPAEAIVPSMPRHAIDAVGDAAQILGAAAIGAELAGLEPPEIAARPIAGVLT